MRGPAFSPSGRARGFFPPPHRLDLPQVFPTRLTPETHLARNTPDWLALDQHLVPNHMNLIHPQHPPAGVPATRKPGGSISERPKGQFLGGAIKELQVE